VIDRDRVSSNPTTACGDSLERLQRLLERDSRAANTFSTLGSRKTDAVEIKPISVWCRM
jgi:hypothetical protein